MHQHRLRKQEEPRFIRFTLPKASRAPRRLSWSRQGLGHSTRRRVPCWSSLQVRSSPRTRNLMPTQHHDCRTCVRRSMVPPVEMIASTHGIRRAMCCSSACGLCRPNLRQTRPKESQVSSSGMILWYRRGRGWVRCPWDVRNGLDAGRSVADMDILEQENKRATRPIAKKGASHSQSALCSCSSTPRS